MREITASGQTVEDAVKSALEQLQTTEDQVEIEVIDEGKRGILGIFGSKLAVVHVKESKNQIEETEQFILEVAHNMGIQIELTTTVEDNFVTFDMQGEGIALLIGKRGQTLNALQYLVQLAINKDGKEFYRVMLDAEGYRGRRKETLETLALRMAEKAKRLNQKVALEPMPAYERKIIHTVLQNRNDVSTESGGAEPHRHIVIKPK
ncbi:MAG TPA: RNA-binding cell elongation regulator Jag/EloR [Bacillota bacterium]|nr:RNA-binding cell elongation regulator Jag/EloR [Bacillota bacterium]